MKHPYISRGGATQPVCSSRRWRCWPWCTPASGSAANWVFLSPCWSSAASSASAWPGAAPQRRGMARLIRPSKRLSGILTPQHRER